MTIRIDIHSRQPALLGESPLWDPARACLWWVDARDCRIRACDMAGKLLTDWQIERPVGSIGLAAGGLIAALDDGFYHIDGATGQPRLVAAVPPPAEGLRLNDGKTDRQGRFLSGHMRPTGGAAGALWQLATDGSIRRLETGIGIANGLAFSPDGRVMYFADSATGILRRYAYDPATGAIAERRDLIDTRPLGSVPDGATVDSEGRIWIALVLAHKIGCFAADGSLLRLIDSPVQYPSCPAFGGPDLDVLFVTTIAHSGHSLISTSDHAGHVLAIRGLEARGLAETPWTPSAAQETA